MYRAVIYYIGFSFGRCYKMQQSKSGSKIISKTLGTSSKKSANLACPSVKLVMLVSKRFLFSNWLIFFSFITESMPPKA